MSTKNIIITYLISALCAIIVITITGFSKAYTSYKLGDKAIKNLGKVSLNPKKHFEIIGFIFMIFFNYGWSTPLDTSPLYYKNRKKGVILTSLVPLIVALVCAFLCIIINRVISTFHIPYVLIFFNKLSLLFISFFVFNLIPVYPLHGQKLLQMLLPSNKSIIFSQYEKILQLVIIFLLLSGILTNILSYIVSFIYFILSLPFSF